MLVRATLRKLSLEEATVLEKSTRECGFMVLITAAQWMGHAKTFVFTVDGAFAGALAINQLPGGDWYEVGPFILLKQFRKAFADEWIECFSEILTRELPWLKDRKLIWTSHNPAAQILSRELLDAALDEKYIAKGYKPFAMYLHEIRLVLSVKFIQALLAKGKTLAENHRKAMKTKPVCWTYDPTR